MKQSIKVTGWLLPLWLALSAMSGNVQALNLNEYVTEVVQTHPLLFQRIHNYRQLVEDENIAKAGWRPSVDLTASVGDYNTNSPITGLVDRDYNSDSTALTITQNLYKGHDTTNAIKQTRARRLSELQRIYDDADNIAIDAIGLYIEAVKEARLAELARRNVDAHARILQQITEHTSSGVGRQSDQEHAAARLAEARAGLIAQQNNLLDTLTKVHFYLGRYLSEEELVAPSEVDVPDGTIDVLVATAFDQHPAMKSAALNISAAQYDYERVKSQFLPNVDLKLSKLRGDDIGGFDGPTDEYSISLEMSYNLYNGGKSTAERRKKLSGIYGHRDFASRVRRQITQSLRLSWAANEALGEQLDYLSAHVDASNRTLESYREEFLVGRRDLLDLLDAEGELNDSLVKLAEAELDKVYATYRVREGLGELFDAMNLAVELGEEELKIVNLSVNQVDSLPFDFDIDKDGEPDISDQCENSTPGAVTRFGCETQIDADFEYSAAVETAIQNAVENIEAQERREQFKFGYKSEQLTQADNARLIALIDELKSNSDSYSTIEVLTYTDNVGSNLYNLRLSERRAEAVRQRLVENGIDASRVTAVGMGETNPIADNSTDEGRARNRRVEFVISPAIQ